MSSETVSLPTPSGVKERSRTMMARPGAGSSIRRVINAIISRFKAKTGGFVVSIAGVGAAANQAAQAAADFVSDPEQMGKILRQAPRGWQDKNMQMVLHTAILNRVPVSVDVQALYFW
jgi:hypothetical protein